MIMKIMIKMIMLQKKFNNFFEILFSLNNIENNLIYLNIKFAYCKIKSEFFESINNFKSLRYLYIENINFDKDFIIKLNILELLSIISCNNIKLSEIPNEKLKELVISRNYISDFNILEKVKFKFKELIKLKLSYNKISDINLLENVNFKGLIVLNLSNNEISDINILKK